MPVILTMKNFMDNIRENPRSEETVSLLKAQAGWASSMVYLDKADDDKVTSAMISWRVGANIGKHTKLKWLPYCYFFEHDTDALMFMLSFGDADTLE